MAPLKCYYDGGDYVIAESKADASLAWQESTGANHEKESDASDEESWEECDMNGTLRADLDDNPATARTQTFAEWIAELGRGWFCSENY